MIFLPKAQCWKNSYKYYMKHLAKVSDSQHKSEKPRDNKLSQKALRFAILPLKIFKKNNNN